MPSTLTKFAEHWLGDSCCTGEHCKSDLVVLQSCPSVWNCPHVKASSTQSMEVDSSSPVLHEQIAASPIQVDCRGAQAAAAVGEPPPPSPPSRRNSDVTRASGLTNLLDLSENPPCVEVSYFEHFLDCHPAVLAAWEDSCLLPFSGPKKV